MLLGVKPHWAVAFFEDHKNCENKTRPWPYAPNNCLRADGLRWIGVVASACSTSLADYRSVAYFAQRESPQERREYTCKNHLIGLLLMGPPTPESIASRWAIHEEWAVCKKMEDGPRPGFILKKYYQWSVHRAIRLKQTIPGFDAPLGNPWSMRKQPAAAKKVNALTNKIRRRGESLFTM